MPESCPWSLWSRGLPLENLQRIWDYGLCFSFCWSNGAGERLWNSGVIHGRSGHLSFYRSGRSVPALHPKALRLLWCFVLQRIWTREKREEEVKSSSGSERSFLGIVQHLWTARGSPLCDTSALKDNQTGRFSSVKRRHLWKVRNTQICVDMINQSAKQFFFLIFIGSFLKADSLFFRASLAVNSDRGGGRTPTFWAALPA